MWADYCGGCNARFFQDGKEVTEDCNQGGQESVDKASILLHSLKVTFLHVHLFMDKKAGKCVDELAQCHKWIHVAM